MADRFKMGGSRRSMPAGLQPLVDRAFGIAGGRKMMGEQLGLALDKIGEMLFPALSRHARAIPAVAARNRVE